MESGGADSTQYRPRSSPQVRGWFSGKEPASCHGLECRPGPRATPSGVLQSASHNGSFPQQAARADSTEVVRTYTGPVADSRRWAGFEHRAGDIVISTPSKCGTTWTQMLVALLVFDGPEFPEQLGVVSPWLENDFTPVDEICQRLVAQQHRRFIKTHTPLDGFVAQPALPARQPDGGPRDARATAGPGGRPGLPP